METFEAITKRYACRSYTDEQLTMEETEMLIKAANASPAASNNYKVTKLTVVQNKELLSEIEKNTAHALPVLKDHPTFQAPTLMILSVKPNENVPFLPYCNASVIAENIMIQATSLGLASVFLMGVPLVMQQKKELLKKLNIIDDFIPIIVVAVGHAKNQISVNKPNRLNVEIL